MVQQMNGACITPVRDDSSSDAPCSTSASVLLPFRLLYPMGSRKWNCRAAPNKQADLLGAYNDGQTILAQQVVIAGTAWLAVTLPGGAIGWCKQMDEAHMVQHHGLRTGYGWYKVQYCSLTDERTYGMCLETLTPELIQDLAAAAPSPPAPGAPRPPAAGAASSGPSSSSSGTCPPAAAPAAGPAAPAAAGRLRCAACCLPLRAGALAYVGSCGHSYCFECLKQLGDANICTACGTWFAVGQTPPESCPGPSPTSIFQHVHQALWFVPPFYRYVLIYGAMLLASPFVVLASWLGLL